MALVTYTPLASDANGRNTVLPDATEEEFSAHNETYATAKYIYKPMADEVLALIRDNVANLTYGKVYTCGAGLNPGDPVYISAFDTVTLADATTEATARVIGYVASPKLTTTTVRIVHFFFYDAGGYGAASAGDPIYLSDTGTFVLTPGTIPTKIGIVLSATDGMLFGHPSSEIDLALANISGVLPVDNGGNRIIHKRKSADQTVTDSTTFVNDSHLFATLTSAKKYAFELSLFTTCVVTSGIKLDFDNSSATVNNFVVTALLYDSGSNTTMQQSSTLGGDLSYPSDIVHVQINGEIEVNAGGTFGLRFAQVSETGASESVTLKRGSHMILTEFA